MVVKYLVFGGWIVSPNDGDRHYISARTVARLYRLKYGEYVLADDDRLLGIDTSHLICLTPQARGNYTLPGIGVFTRE